MRHMKDWSLKHKIIFHIFIISALSALFLFYLYTMTQKNIINTMIRQKSELIGSMIESSLFQAMKSADFEKVQTTIEDISAAEDISKIQILYPDGKIMRSSLKQEVGKFSNIFSKDRLRKNIFEEYKPSIILNKSKAVIQSFRPIMNRRECNSCHSPSQKIIGVLEVNIDHSEASILLKKSHYMGIIIALIAVGILTLIILRLFEKLINRPIYELKNKMEKVQSGNLDIDLSPTKNDEIGSLTKSFAVMIRKLKIANQKIEELFKKQMEKAEHLASIGELAAGLAHEIKNPIAGMKGALEIINHKTDPSDPNKEIFKEILFQIDKINRIIQDLLSYARPKEMNMGLVDPNECVENAIRLARPQMSNKDIHFHFKKLENGLLARIDADKIQEVMLNMMLNSIAAINKKGKISIEFHKGNHTNLEIIFSDDGAGIKQEHLSHIFNPFFTTKTQGTGLGLSICKNIIEAHKGTVEVKSTEGKGTTFFISLPVLQVSE